MEHGLHRRHHLDFRVLVDDRVEDAVAEQSAPFRGELVVRKTV